MKFLDEVIIENEGVVKSKEERIGLLKVEVEKRGQVWIEPGKKDEEAQAPVVNGTGHGAAGQENAGGRDADDGVYL